MIESIILAAGYSSRFNFKDSSYKKFLLTFERSTILNYVIVGMISAGIEKINVIVDENAKISEIKESCMNFLKKTTFNSTKLQLNFIENNSIDRENGFSLFLGAKEISSEYFILSMADHIFSVNVYENLINNYINQDIDIVLATDPMKIKGYYDVDDCTKVIGSNLQIKEIGKTIHDYNRLDMGAFIMKTSTIQKISQEVEKNKYKFGVYDIVISAINLNLKVSYLDFPNTIWLDVDTHTEYEKLKKIFSKSSEYRPFNLDVIIEKSSF